MSTKKDKFSFKDQLYMELALDLAKARKGLTGSNPSVGCVIVKDDKIISIGQTSFNGRPHAELNAINRLMRSVRERLMSEDISITGFTVGTNDGEAAGQTVMHSHLHLIPRRVNDMDDARGGVRGVIPERQKY